MASFDLTPILGAPERLEALRAAAVLDTPPEEAFDRLTRLATRILRAPVALVSLVTDDRQFFKSCIGLPEPWATKRETPLSHSFCQYVVASTEAMVVQDARSHPLVCDNLAIPDLAVIAYAGVPLIDSGGHALGSLCVIDSRPREWTAEELAILHDLAQSVMTELELRAAHAEAERRGEEARVARAEAERANLVKAQFLAVVSHEIRTPLHAIGAYAQLLELGIRGPVSPRQVEALRHIRNNQHHLLGLINELLDFAKVEVGRVEYAIAEVPLLEALAGLDASVGPQLEAKGLHFLRPPLPPDAPTALADGDKVRQILINLLSNAVKFTPAGGTVALEWDADPSAVHVRVRDTGIGIPPDKLATIFDPFVRLSDVRAGAQEGAGLGLAIGRELARGMGGDLMVESEVGRGSTFTLTLPRGRE